MSIIVYGPPGFITFGGMEQLREYFCCDTVVDADFDPYPLSKKQVDEFKEGKILFLTTIDPDVNGYHLQYGRVYPHHLALQAAGINQNEYQSAVQSDQEPSGQVVSRPH